MHPRRAAILLSAVGIALAVAAAAAALRPSGDERSTLRLTRVVSGLDEPLFVGAPRGETERLYVVEKDGRVRVVDSGRLQPQPFLDIGDLVSKGGEQGLLGLAFHPRYAANRRFFVPYTDRAGDTRIAEYRSEGGRAVSEGRRQLLFVDQPYENHNGGQLAFGPDGRLYLGLGDGGAGGDPGNRAQNLRSRLGKLLSLDVDRRGAKWRIDGFGLRNPWRFSFDRANGDLYIGDVGQSEQEEIDRVRRGSRGVENYGWRVWEGRNRYTNETPNRFGRLVFPVAVYGRSDGCTVIGGHVYRGAAVPAARGRYFYGDFCSGRIWSLRAGRGPVGVRRESLRVESLSSFGEDARGELYLTSLEGTVFRLGE